MNDKVSEKNLLDELKRLLAASKEGNFDFKLSDEGLTLEDAQIVRVLNEIQSNYKTALEYDLMKYRLTSDALGIGLWDMDIVSGNPADRNNRLIWSQEVRRMLGFSDVSDFPNLLSSLTDRIHPEDKERAINAFAAHVTDKTGKLPFDVEYRVMMKDGRYRHFHAYGTTLRDGNGSPLRVAGAIEDIEDKKNMQESLRRAEEERLTLLNMSNILDGLNAMICVTDPVTYDILFINKSMQKTFGIEDSGNGRKCYEVIRDFKNRCAFCPCEELDKNPEKEVVWEQHNNLTNRVYRSYSRYIDWPNGKTVHIQNAVDVTDIKQAQHELENQNMRLNLLVKGLNVGLWDRFVDPNQAYEDKNAKIWWSDEFRNLLGYTDENDFPNEIGSWLNSVHPDDLQKTIDAMTAFLGDKTGHTHYDIENRMRLKSGEYRWFRSFGSAIRDEDGNPIRTAGATEDITERMEAEREIAEKNEFNQVLFENAPVGVTLFDENYKYLGCNENILRMFGGITREVYSTFFGSSDHSPEYQPDGRNSIEKAFDIIRRTVTNGEVIKTEWLHNMPDGQPLPVELTLMRIKQGDRYIGLAYIYDMREQTKLKNELEEALRNAENANKAKSDFLAKMSHEIRTPMNAILGITEIQMRSGTLSEDTEEALGRIYESGNLLMSIINDILDLSKIEADKLEILPVKYDISSLINDTVQINRLRYDSKPIGFSVKLDENTPHNFVGDELRIKQILNNLLSNAYKYTDKGSIELSIFTEKLDCADAGREEDVLLVFSVSDTGQGMSADQVEDLFTEYTRFNLEANRTTIGTGLGLSITKSLVDLMGGSIEVSSEVGVGSVFTVRIPQRRVGTEICGAGLAEKIQDTRFKSTSMTKKTQFVREYMPYGSVLVVDDVDSNTYVTKGMLLPYGLSVETASSGFEAVDKIKSGSVYDIVFMDHMMPVMDGIEATGIIRDAGYTNPIIALTANALVGQAEMFLANGFDGYMSKPIDSRELNLVLNEYIRGRKPPEVVEAARLEQLVKAKHTPAARTKLAAADLARFVVSDVTKALKVLDEALLDIDAADGASLKQYIVTVHGLKSALANIGENKLSADALVLEEAGNDGDIALVTEKTPGFIEELRELSEKLSEAKSACEVSMTVEDKAYMRDKLREFKEACEAYNANAARLALNDLTGKTRPDNIGKALDAMSMHLLHSDFEQAAQTADTIDV